MKEAFTKLLKVKSILSLLCAGLLVYCSVTNKIDGKDALTIIVMVFTYYFARQNKNGEIEE